MRLRVLTVDVARRHRAGGRPVDGARHWPPGVASVGCWAAPLGHGGCHLRPQRITTAQEPRRVQIRRWCPTRTLTPRSEWVFP
jgi:hypothetical protein